MPFRSRAKLLAGMAALLGLCAAGAGCQTGAVCQSGGSDGCGGMCAPAVAPATCATCQTGGSRKPVFNVVRRPTTQEPPTLAGPCTNGCCSSAVMLRPVPASNPTGPTGGPELQRVSGEVGVVSTDTGVARLATLERPQPVTFVPATRPDSSVLPVPAVGNDPAGVVTAPPPPLARSGTGAARNTLPQPRLVPKAQNAKVALPEGYPQLPPATITHPPEAPREFAMRAYSDYIVEPPDVLQIDLAGIAGDKNFPIRGTHLIRPDGTVGLGPIGAVFVAGLTLEQAKTRIAQRLAETYASADKRAEKFKDVMEALKVDVAAYNSKFYYVITDGGGFGEQVYRVLCTGNEKVLDAISQIAGLPAVASKSQIWVARATPVHFHSPNILPVDWCGITQRGEAGTNYQIYPGDRIYVNSNKLIRIDSFLAKVLSPIERLLGVTLLGSTTVNSIKNGGMNGTGTR